MKDGSGDEGGKALAVRAIPSDESHPNFTNAEWYRFTTKTPAELAAELRLGFWFVLSVVMEATWCHW